MQPAFHIRDVYDFGVHLTARMAFYALPFSWLVQWARLQGLRKYLSNSLLRDVVFNNVYQAFADDRSERELRRLTRGILQVSEVLNVCAFFHHKFSDAALEKWFPIRGLEHLDAALKQRRGVILLSGHLGPHFIVRHRLRQKSYEVRGLRFKGGDGAAPARSRLATFIDTRVRLKRYEEPEDGYFEVGFNPRPVAKYLQNNGVLFTMADGVHSLTYAKLPFLNNEVPFSLGTMSLARGTGAVVLPVRVEGVTGTRQFQTIVDAPMELQVTKDRQRDIYENTRRYVKMLEQQIVRHPYNWRNWMYRDYFTRINQFVSETTDRHARVFGHGLS